MPVYMIQAGKANGPLKIGFASDPKRRLTMLQTGHHERLSIMRLFEGTIADEAGLHAKFATHRVRNEWFAFDEAMLGDVGLNEIVIEKPRVREVLAERCRNPLQSQLLCEVEVFLRTTGTRDTTFGIRAVNDGKFVNRLRAGKNMMVGTIERVQRFLQEG